jgi:hypothetical protein
VDEVMRMPRDPQYAPAMESLRGECRPLMGTGIVKRMGRPGNGVPVSHSQESNKALFLMETPGGED